MAAVSRITGATLLAGLSSYSILKSQRVYAESVKIHPRELDIYAEPAPPPSEEDEGEEDISALERHVGMVRKKCCKVSDSFKGTRQSVGETFNTGKSKASEFAQLIQTDRTFQLKVGAITVSTIAGVALAGRGKRPLRRILLGSALGLTAASICYPNVAVETSLRSYNKIKEAAIKQWEAYKSKAPESVTEKTAEDKEPETEKIPDTVEQGSEDMAKEEAITESAALEASKEEAAVVEEEVKVAEVDQSKPETVEAPTESAEEDVSAVEESVSPAEKPVETHVPWYESILQRFKSKPATPAPAEATPEPEATPQETPAPPVVEAEETPIPDENSAPPAQEMPAAPAEAKVEGDPGMSESEDQDMYSTRS